MFHTLGFASLSHWTLQCDSFHLDMTLKYLLVAFHALAAAEERRRSPPGLQNPCSLHVGLSPASVYVRDNAYNRSVFAGRPCKTLSFRLCSPLCPSAASYKGYLPSSNPALMSKGVTLNLSCPLEPRGGGAVFNKY